MMTILQKPSLNATSIKRMIGVDPNLVKLMTEGVKSCPVHYEVVEGLRTLQRQRELYNQGRLTPGPIVTKTMDSMHLKQKDGWGHAVDICPFKDGKFLWNDKVGFEKIFYHLNKVANDLNIVVRTGSDWDMNLVIDEQEKQRYLKVHGKLPFVDWPHWETPNGR